MVSEQPRQAVLQLQLVQPHVQVIQKLSLQAALQVVLEHVHVQLREPPVLIRASVFPALDALM